MSTSQQRRTISQPPFCPLSAHRDEQVPNLRHPANQSCLITQAVQRISCDLPKWLGGPRPAREFLVSQKTLSSLQRCGITHLADCIDDSQNKTVKCIVLLLYRWEILICYHHLYYHQEKLYLLERQSHFKDTEQIDLGITDNSSTIFICTISVINNNINYNIYIYILYI